MKTEGFRKEIKFPVHIVLTDREVVFKENGEIFRLSKETGWWDSSNTVYIWHSGMSSIMKFGVLIHEIVEMFLEKVLVPHRIAHTIANIVENVLTLRQSKTYPVGNTKNK